MENSRKKTTKAWTRRDFLKGFGGGALGTAVIPKLLAPHAESLQTKEGNVPVFSKKRIALTVNGRDYSLVVEPRETLLDILRERINLTGAKRICDRGECGGCTVLMDGRTVYSCMYLAIRADGRKITTVEGVAGKDTLHPVQQAFIEKDGYQCGFCTPGFIMSTIAFLEKTPHPDFDAIKSALSGNLCRCGNYFKIYDAVGEATKIMRRS